jgi:hypothetical protein
VVRHPRVVEIRVAPTKCARRPLPYPRAEFPHSFRSHTFGKIVIGGNFQNTDQTKIPISFMRCSAMRRQTSDLRGDGSLSMRALIIGAFAASLVVLTGSLALAQEPEPAWPELGQVRPRHHNPPPTHHNPTTHHYSRFRHHHHGPPPELRTHHNPTTHHCSRFRHHHHHGSPRCNVGH